MILKPGKKPTLTELYNQFADHEIRMLAMSNQIKDLEKQLAAAADGTKQKVVALTAQVTDLTAQLAAAQAAVASRDGTIATLNQQLAEAIAAGVDQATIDSLTATRDLLQTLANG